MILSLIAAVDEDNVIGLGNTLPWDIPADLKYFRDKTKGQIVIMGRKTFDSIVEKLDHPLPDRRNVVITREGSMYAGDYDQVPSLDEAIQLAEEAKAEEAFIIGGEQIYELAMGFAHRIYLTRIHGHFEGDKFFPIMEKEDWKEVSREEHEADSDNPQPYTFFVYERDR
jgi:dihydrofolate reductase